MTISGQDGIEIIGYRGGATDIIIPNNFEGNPVLVVGELELTFLNNQLTSVTLRRRSSPLTTITATTFNNTPLKDGNATTEATINYPTGSAYESEWSGKVDGSGITWAPQ